MKHKVEVYGYNNQYKVLVEGAISGLEEYGTYNSADEAIAVAEELSDILNNHPKLIWKNY